MLKHIPREPQENSVEKRYYHVENSCEIVRVMINSFLLKFVKICITYKIRFVISNHIIK